VKLSGEPLVSKQTVMRGTFTTCPEHLTGVAINSDKHTRMGLSFVLKGSAEG